MDALVLPLQPTRQGTPYVIDTGDVPGTEKVLLYKAHAVFNRAFAFRVCLIAYPELEFLLCTEILKDRVFMTSPYVSLATNTAS